MPLEYRYTTNEYEAGVFRRIGAGLENPIYGKPLKSHIIKKYKKIDTLNTYIIPIEYMKEITLREINRYLETSINNIEKTRMNKPRMRSNTI